MERVTIEELREHPHLKDFPEETLQWIIDKSEVRTFEVDEVMTKTGEPIEHMWIIVYGSYDFYWDTNGQLTYTASWKDGDIAGLLPYSRMKASPGYAISTSKGKALMLHKKYFEEMEKSFPDLVKRLVEILTDRVRFFTASQQQQEKMSALGRMSAGLAHELNNPAAAIRRTSVELNTRLATEIDNVLRIIDDHPDKKRITDILLILKEKVASSLYNSVSPLKKSQLEDELIEQLEALNIDDGQRIAETFADIGVTPEELVNITSSLSQDSVETILLWVENIVIAERLVIEIQKASTRISQLVDSIKSYVHMDQTYDMQPTDVHNGLDSTLILLNHKLKAKKIEIIKEYAADLPQVNAFPGELNQVWTNIIDNAIDALDNSGILRISTSVGRNMIQVSIVDSGHGIRQEIKDKIFDPFFTTKSVGKGVGLGLDMVKRIVNKHQGEIKVFSEPGRTEFVVCFPISRKIEQQESSAGKVLQ